MIEILVILIILLTEFGIVATHVWAREDHTHWVHKPWVDTIDAFNWFHVASFFSHWPIVLFVMISYIQYYLWIPIAMGSWLIWQLVKMANNKDWDPIWIQIYKGIKSKWS